MKKTLSVIMIIMSLLCMTSVLAGCGKDADYPNPQEMYAAHAGGQNVKGKTVLVDANKDYTYGQIFSAPTPNLGPTMYINAEGAKADRIKYHDEVVIKITDIRESKFQISFTGTIVE